MQNLVCGSCRDSVYLARGVCAWETNQAAGMLLFAPPESKKIVLFVYLKGFLEFEIFES